MRVRLRDIADELGVSTVTVWKAVQNHSDLSVTTRDRILQRVKERGYRPNLTARGLVTGHSSLIGLVVPDLIHPFFAEVAKSLSSVLRKHGYLLIIASSEEDPLLEVEEIHHLLSHHLDALVVASAQTSFEGLRLIEETGIPLVLLDRSLSPDSNFVGSDDYLAGCLAAEHLLEIGCKRCGHIRGPENSVGRGRYEGFRDTLGSHGVELDPQLVVIPRSFDVAGGKRGAESMRYLLERRLAVDGLFCFNDGIAIGAMAVALERGRRIPEDLAVIGCGNLHYDSSLRVPLTSIDQASGAMGKQVGSLLLGIFKGQTSKPYQQIVLPPHLVVRVSTHKGLRLGTGDAGPAKRIPGAKMLVGDLPPKRKLRVNRASTNEADLRA